MDIAIETDELFVISDTHLGGVKGAQIFDATKALKWLLGDLAKQADATKTRQFTLVINGDFVDFLAEPQPVYFDPRTACDRLDRILLHEAGFRGILGALREFAGKRNCRLIINLGNHDLELALPWVRDHLLDMLSEGNAAPRARIDLLTDGAGCRLSVNGVQVLCAHGNEVDAWNVTDHETIRRIARDILRGQDPDPWIPNAGTQMVIEVMNDIKRAYPFVDVLKPETGAVVPILAALKPSLAARLAQVSKVVLRRARDGGLMKTGFLGEVEGAMPEPALTAALPPLGEGELRDRTTQAAQQILEEANARHMSGVRPIDLVTGDMVADQLGLFTGAKAWLTGRSLSEQLRHELKPLAKDRSFALDTEDSYFEAFDRLAGREIDVIVTGHTHLRRALPRKVARGFYYNTGTWARVIQITEDLLNDQTRFDAFFAAIGAGRMAALDKLDGLVQRQNPVFSASADGAGATLQLNQVTGSGAAMKLVPVAGTENRVG